MGVIIVPIYECLVWCLQKRSHIFWAVLKTLKWSDVDNWSDFGSEGVEGGKAGAQVWIRAIDGRQLTYRWGGQTMSSGLKETAEPLWQTSRWAFCWELHIGIQTSVKVKGCSPCGSHFQSKEIKRKNSRSRKRVTFLIWAHVEYASLGFPLIVQGLILLGWYTSYCDHNPLCLCAETW